MSSPDLITILESIQGARLTLQKLTRSVSTHPTSAEVTVHSDISDETSTSPSTLKIELAHYKELCSQLRFSYLEQVTKERFLRSITDDQREIPETEDNAQLEELLRGAKEKLKSSKREVEEILAELEAVAQRLAPAYEQLTRDISKVRTLPEETEAMKNQIETLLNANDTRRGMNLPLSDTLEHIGAAESELRMLETELENLETKLPRKKRHLENLDRVISEHERNKEGLEKFASEAVRAREGARAAGKADRENTGQWYKSSYEILTALLE
ncbi:hypothetical protein BDD12DRAFT_896642 [Trichophaea hybrida]|nr:hypothetical protein BDD12DRAFT_896642 [Trichophaea hybrida]